MLTQILQMGRRADKQREPNAAFGKRLRDARYDAQKVIDRRLSDEYIGKVIAALTGRSTAYTRGAVGKWFAGWEPESFAVVEALGQMLGADPGWLAFGERLEARPMTAAELAAVLDPPAAKRKRRPA